jgi:hypothetical protein
MPRPIRLSFQFKYAMPWWQRINLILWGLFIGVVGLALGMVGLVVAYALLTAIIHT